MSKVDEARDAICDHIVRRIEDYPTAAELDDLASAYSKVVHGPQGGSVGYHYASDVTNSYESSQPRGAGFSAP